MTTLAMTLRAAPAIPDVILHPFRTFSRWFGQKMDQIALKRAERCTLAFEAALPGAIATLDLERLNIGHPLDCVVGQIFRSKGRHDPWWLGGNGVRMGLDVSWFGSYFIGYPRLTRAWKIVGGRYKAAAH